MQVKTQQQTCPCCGADRLVYSAATSDGDYTEFPCWCESCGWAGAEQYRGDLFIWHLTAAGVVCGYSLT